MTGMDLMRHWGKRDFVDEVSDSDSEFGNRLLPTILEEDGGCRSDDEDIFDQEYGNSDEVSLSEDEESDDDFDGVVEEEEGSDSFHNTELNHAIGGDNLLLNVPSSATGKYKTVSVFGSVFDMPDPNSDSDSLSSSSDFSDDDWSVEGSKPVVKKTAVTKPRSNLMNRQQQKNPAANGVQTNRAIEPKRHGKIDRIEDMSPLTDPNPRNKSTSADRCSTSPTCVLRKASCSSSSSEDELETLSESFSTLSDTLLEKDKLCNEPLEARQNLLAKFLSELSFFPVTSTSY
eukprot:scaffold22680_cov107-Cylindrotheca_fusiformis.AAC.20